MSADRYLRILLTIIALELGWIAIKDSAAVQVSAQQKEPMPTPVVIRGIELLPNNETFLPVSLVRTATPVRVISDRPLQVENVRPLTIQSNQPLIVETAQRPLQVEVVPAPAGARPGLPDQR